MAVLQGGLSLPTVKPVATQPLYNPMGASVQPITAANANNWNQQINQLSKNYQGLYATDETLQGQLRNLQAQMQGGWSGVGGVVPQAQQLALQWGGALPGGVAQFASPEFGGKTVGPSLMQALSDPVLMANAQNNPFSTVNAIANRLRGQNFTGMHNLGGSGLSRSGAVNAVLGANSFQAQKERYEKGNEFLGALSQLYGGFMGKLDQAAQTQSGYYNDAFARATELIKNNILGTPTKIKAAPTTGGGGGGGGRGTTGTTQPGGGWNPRGYHMAGIPGTWGNISPNTGMTQYKPFQDAMIGPHGRAPLGAEQGMYRLGSGFKITPGRGRALR